MFVDIQWKKKLAQPRLRAALAGAHTCSNSLSLKASLLSLPCFSNYTTQSRSLYLNSERLQLRSLSLQSICLSSVNTAFSNLSES